MPYAVYCRTSYTGCISVPLFLCTSAPLHLCLCTSVSLYVCSTVLQLPLPLPCPDAALLPCRVHVYVSTSGCRVSGCCAFVGRPSGFSDQVSQKVYEMRAYQTVPSPGLSPTKITLTFKTVEAHVYVYVHSCSPPLSQISIPLSSSLYSY